jgi:hypothetical protein
MKLKLEEKGRRGYIHSSTYIIDIKFCPFMCSGCFRCIFFNVYSVDSLDKFFCFIASCSIHMR